MVHTYKITGMTCTGCEYAVKSYLQKVPEVESVELSKDTGLATITMLKHVSLSDLQKALSVNPKYQISEQLSAVSSQVDDDKRSWIETYKPLLILFSLILCISCIAAFKNLMNFTNLINYQVWMRYFMAGFFLSFSYFKLINIKAFADSYSMYDIVAKRIKVWGIVYPFAELGLGLAYLINFFPLYTNIATVVIMGVSTIGVIQSVANKKRIQCACLGAVFNLPMSTVTIIEDLLMVVMAGVMIFML